MCHLHFTLRPRFNARLCILWGAALVGAWALAAAPPGIPTICGSLAGWLGGFLQLTSIREADDRFRESKTAVDVRNALQSTRAGKLYLLLFWVSGLCLIGWVISKSGPLLVMTTTLLSAYSAFALLRELVTLPATLRLAETSATLRSQEKRP